jgi:hypothetical protein
MDIKEAFKDLSREDLLSASLHLVSVIEDCFLCMTALAARANGSFDSMPEDMKMSMSDCLDVLAKVATILDPPNQYAAGPNAERKW